MLCALLLFFAADAQAKYKLPQLETVPVQRLLKNLQAELSHAQKPAERARLEFGIGRLHSMAYALKSESVSVDKNTSELEHLKNVPDRDDPAPDPAAKAAAAEHLRRAVVHLRRALALSPNDLRIKLGLGWCRERSGDKTGAIKLYREIVSADVPDAKAKTDPDSAVVAEAARYLSHLIDEDSAEYSSLLHKSLSLHAAALTHITPILVPLTGDPSPLTAAQPVSFDADGLGRRSFQPWPTTKAGWLVWDPKHDGKIDSGLRLFGSVSFWLFWDNGYEALRALDDDHDGKLDGGELKGLAIWQDRNGDGISQEGEVKPLSDWGIVALSYQARKDAQGMWYSPSGVRFASGETRPTYDLILTEAPSIMRTATDVQHPMMIRPIPVAGGVR